MGRSRAICESKADSRSPGADQVSVRARTTWAGRREGRTLATWTRTGAAWDFSRVVDASEATSGVPAGMGAERDAACTACFTPGEGDVKKVLLGPQTAKPPPLVS